MALRSPARPHGANLSGVVRTTWLWLAALFVAACGPGEEGIRYKEAFLGNASGAKRLYDLLATREGRGLELKVNGTSHPITYGAEVEQYDFDEAHRVFLFIGLHLEAWDRCLAELLDDADAFQAEVLHDLWEIAQRRRLPVSGFEGRERLFTPPSAPTLASAEERIRWYESWRSSLRDWRPPADARPRGQPMASLSREFLFAFYRGEISGQRRAFAGLSPGLVCEVAARSESWVPHPGRASMHFGYPGALSWVSNGVSIDWELHWSPKRRLREVDEFFSWWREMTAEDEDRDVQLWIVFDRGRVFDETQPARNAALSNYLRHLQAYLFLGGLEHNARSAPADMPEETLRRLMIKTLALRWIQPQSDAYLRLPDARDVLRGALRVMVDAFGAEARTRTTQSVYAELDYPHLALELRFAMADPALRDRALRATVARAATGYLRDFASIAEEGCSTEGLSPLPLIEDLDAWRSSPSFEADLPRQGQALLERFATRQPSLTSEDVEALLRALQPLVRVSDPASTAPFYAGIAAPLWRWDRSPCLSIEERARIDRAGRAWIAELLSDPQAFASYPWPALARWLTESAVVEALGRCLEPRPVASN